MDIIRAPGDEYYYMVFSDNTVAVEVYEYIFNDTEEYYRKIFSRDNSESLILCGNISDIIPNLKIVITDINGNKVEYIPFISLKDGSVSVDQNGKVIDYTIL